MCDAASLCHRCVRPVNDVALLHLTHIEEDVFAHLDVLAEGHTFLLLVCYLKI